MQLSLLPMVSSSSLYSAIGAIEFQTAQILDESQVSPVWRQSSIMSEKALRPVAVSLKGQLPLLSSLCLSRSLSLSLTLCQSVCRLVWLLFVVRVGAVLYARKRFRVFITRTTWHNSFYSALPVEARLTSSSFFSSWLSPCVPNLEGDELLQQQN